LSLKEVPFSPTLGHRFAYAKRAVTPPRQMMLDTRRVRAERGANFHSPPKTPDKVAVIIMKIWKSPQPIEVPKRPR
jgi:hypothetical protein